MLGRITGNTDTLDSPRPGLGGSHHLPPYNILCASPWGPHPNDFLSRDSQVGVPKLPKLGVPQLWKPITLRANLRLRCGLKQNCSFCQKLSNSMWHVTCTQGNQGDSWLLVVGSQTSNLSQPHFGISVKMKLTPPKVGSWSPSGLPKTQSSSSRVKTPRIDVFFISMKSSWSVDAQNGLACAIWTSAAQVMGKRKAKSQTSNLTPYHYKSGINLFLTSAEGVRHSVGKLSRRTTTLV